MASQSLRVVFVTPFGLKHKTTVWARILPMAQALVARGQEATILIPPWDSPEDAGKEEVLGGVLLRQLSLGGGLPATILRLVKAVEAQKPDIVHIVKPRAHAGLVQWNLWQRRSQHFKIVLDVDDWEQAWNEVNRYNPLVERFLTWQENWGIRHAHGITAASRWLERQVRAFTPAMPVFYLPNGVSPLPEGLLRPIPDATQTPKVLFFTRFIEAPPAWLRDFWRALLKRVPSAELVIAGAPLQPWLSEPFHAALDDLPHLRWLGFVPGAELPSLYASATCAIFPSLPVPLQQAKCSVRLATTLLHGLPVVASDVGEQANYGSGGAATLVSATATPEEFAQVVAAQLCEPSQHAMARTEATSRMLERYAWSRLTANLPAYYQQILGQR